MIDKIQALEIIDKRDFFNDRAGRELWNDKPKEIQDEDIRNAHEDYVDLREYILADKWISVEERLPEIQQDVLVTIKRRNISYCDLAFLGDNGRWHMSRRIGYIEGNVLAWQPLPERYEVKEND